MENMEIWDKVKQPPPSTLKPIAAGRLKGKTDINPQWRYQVMTEVFGPCGEGWKYEIVRLWNEPGSEEQIIAFAEIKLYVRANGQWSEPIPGIGGSMLVEKEQRGPHTSDEGYKMAVTDALSVAMKMLGVAADIYGGLWDGSKYRDGGSRKTHPASQNKGQAARSPQGASKDTGKTGKEKISPFSDRIICDGPYKDTLKEKYNKEEISIEYCKMKCPKRERCSTAQSLMEMEGGNGGGKYNIDTSPPWSGKTTMVKKLTELKDRELKHFQKKAADLNIDITKLGELTSEQGWELHKAVLMAANEGK